MTLRDIIASLDLFDAEDTIYAAEPWNEHSPALVAREPGRGGLPEEARARGMKYFLEISVAREVLEDSKAGSGDVPAPSAACARVIHYAVYDA